VRDALVREAPALRRALYAGLLVGLSTVGLAGTSAWLIARSAQEPVVLSLTVPMGLVQLFALAKAAGRYVERTQTHRAALSVMGHVRASVARLLEPLLPAGLGPRSTEVVDLVLGDVERVQDLLTAVAGPLITSTLAGLATALAMGLIVPLSALALVVGLVISAFVLPMLAARLGEYAENEMETVRHEMKSLFDRVAQSGDEYVMVGAAEVLERELGELEDRFDRALWRRTTMTGVVNALSTAVAGAVVLAVVGASAMALRRDEIGPALVAVPTLLSVAALEMVGAVAPLVVGLRGDRASLERLRVLSARPVPVVEPDEPAELRPSDQELVANNLARSFDGARVLTNVTLSLVKGDVAVLSGPSGGGKTTLARLLAKFLDPSDGSLRLGSVGYERLESTQVREHVGLVDDAPHVFATSLAGNLRVAKPSAGPEEIEDALGRAGLSSLVATMPEGVDTPLGGATTGLSGGEQRRLGVARELLVQRPVVIFDEPTEGLDEVTAAELMASIRSSYDNGSVLVISHHDTDHAYATRHWILEDGLLHERIAGSD
jgi:thiol reductant ABC exporter CydC subunit